MAGRRIADRVNYKVNLTLNKKSANRKFTSAVNPNERNMSDYTMCLEDLAALVCLFFVFWLCVAKEVCGDIGNMLTLSCRTMIDLSARTGYIANAGVTQILTGSVEPVQRGGS